MLRGKTTFICTHCGHRFVGLNIEFMTTVYTAPLPCPQCGSLRTRPVSLLPTVANKRYELIWKFMEEHKEK
jgi:DNA-directed RNA polymerase subunit RPC12/RpoP